MLPHGGGERLVLEQGYLTAGAVPADIRSNY